MVEVVAAFNNFAGAGGTWFAFRGRMASTHNRLSSPLYLVLALGLPSCATDAEPVRPTDAAAVVRRDVESPLPADPSPATTARATLYERLGGYDAISAVVDLFASKLFSDPVVGRRFVGMSDDSRAAFRQHNKNLVCNVTGGPCKITSRPAEVTHGGLQIKASEFDIVVGHLIDSLTAFSVPAAEQSELLEIVGSLRSKIVEVEDK